jgi:hypothetical protein
MGEQCEDTDLDRLRHRLREEAGKSDPNFWGFEGAIARFVSFNPQGFADPNYTGRERAYKVVARDLLHSLLPIERGLDATAEEAASLAKVVSKTNLLAHQHEQQQMRTILCGAGGQKLVRAAAEIALGDVESGFKTMTAVGQSVGRVSWPIATYLPFLWDARSNMFLKPEVTQDFARRVGHDFAQQYDAALDPAVYSSLLDLVRVTEEKIASLGPEDRIDVQSFIWVVGKYEDNEEHRSPSIQGKADATKRSIKGTTEVGFENRNRQTVLSKTDLPGNDHNQVVYVLQCGECGHQYGANGSDIFLRRCPAHDGGAAGLPYE